VLAEDVRDQLLGEAPSQRTRVEKEAVVDRAERRVVQQLGLRVRADTGDGSTKLMLAAQARPAVLAAHATSWPYAVGVSPALAILTAFPITCQDSEQPPAGPGAPSAWERACTLSRTLPAARHPSA
jgi:hypothetical protein